MTIPTDKTLCAEVRAQLVALKKLIERTVPQFENDKVARELRLLTYSLDDLAHDYLDCADSFLEQARKEEKSENASKNIDNVLDDPRRGQAEHVNRNN